MSSRKVEIVAKKEAVVERGPKLPAKKKVIVLRQIKPGEQYIKKDEMPASIGIPKYFSQLKDADIAKTKEVEQFKDKTIIFLIGGPGCGKGTQSNLILEHYNAGYMSAGDLLRAEAATGTETGQYIEEQMRLGAILPQEITIGLLKKEILRQSREIYIIDGFPRKIDQAITFEKEVCPCAITLMIDVPDEVLVERLMSRAKSSGRCDDNPESIKKRLVTFHSVSEPVFQHFQQDGRSVKIDGNKSPEEVFLDIQRVIDRYLNKSREN